MTQPAPPPGMNAFTLLGFEPALELDEIELQRRFEHLRTQFHPDRFSNGSSLERRLAVQRAADINAAHTLLANPLARARLYFEQRGIALNEAQTMQDHVFLVQQMELREALDEAHDEQARTKLRFQVNELWQQTWQSLQTMAHQNNAENIVRQLQRLQFLQRFQQQMTD